MACPLFLFYLIIRNFVRTARFDPQIGMDKEQERLVDVVMYLVSLAQSAFRYARGQRPFDFESLPTVEFIMARTLPFIENENIDYREVHLSFVQVMFENGWKQGQEDFANRVHPDLVSWEDLTKDSQYLYGYTAGLVCSAKEFYASIKADLEDDFMSSFSSMVIKGKTFVGLKNSEATH